MPDYTEKYVSLLEQNVEDYRDRIAILEDELARWMQLGVFEEVAFNYAFAGQLVNRLSDNSEFIEIMTEVMEELLNMKRERGDAITGDEEDWLKKIMGELNIDGNSMSEGDNDTGGQ